MERRRFTAEFKREAVRQATQPGASRTRVSRELGLNVNMLRTNPSPSRGSDRVPPLALSWLGR